MDEKWNQSLVIQKKRLEEEFVSLVLIGPWTAKKRVEWGRSERVVLTVFKGEHAPEPASRRRSDGDGNPQREGMTDDG
jgi:hypothetical protein